MAIEKRKERRIKVNLPIKIVYQKDHVVTAQTENISRLGAYVETGKKIPLGIDIDITLEIPVYTKDPSLSGEVKCKGNIFRCNFIRETESNKYYGIGIFFTHFFNDADREKLSQYIDFLILTEDKNIKEGIKHWRDKRKIAKETRQAQKISLSQEDYQKETFALLKQILARLEEITRLLQSQNKIK
jgi:hypothetical protein